ncbi:hypothetical protein [Zavarzinella formosa]|uniref:hypothetical protein n=1 Tax=Zavarzinella formosa TaxID=360055 RepID=UPI0002D67AD5|nr:hypothetical protein [Zavarzinella formosa]
MEKSKRYYWAVFEGRQPIFEGSFNDCWKHLVATFGHETVAHLTANGIRISRSN